MVREGRKTEAVSEWEPDFHKACCSLWMVGATNPEVPTGVLFDIVRGRGSSHRHCSLGPVFCSTSVSVRAGSVPGVVRIGIFFLNTGLEDS